MTDLATLAVAYAKAKADEARATEIRRALADRILAATGHAGEGQKTYEADGWKIAVKAPLIRAMNWPVWETVKARIPENLWPVELKPVLDEKGVKWLHANEPTLYAVLAEALTVKPGAVQVQVQEVA